MITATNSAAPTTATANNPQRSALTSDFETFLRMLTVQARNQDPLEPLESSEYASQLAQFSMVEQQVKANELLSDLALSLGAVNLNQLSGWVGMNVQTTGPFKFEDQPVAIQAQAEPTADRAELVIRDEQGIVVSRIPVPTDEVEFEWAGVNSGGDPLPAGVYTAALESFQNGELLSSTPASAFGRVVEAQVSEGAIVLKLDSGAEVPADIVTQIRTGA